jgi:hypothetical protein
MAVMLTWGVLLFWAWPAAAPPMFLHRSVPRERVVGRQPTPPFMRTDADAGKFAFLIPRISRAYASEWGAGGACLRYGGAVGQHHRTLRIGAFAGIFARLIAGINIRNLTRILRLPDKDA